MQCQLAVVLPKAAKLLSTRSFRGAGRDGRSFHIRSFRALLILLQRICAETWLCTWLEERSPRRQAPGHFPVRGPPFTAATPRVAGPDDCRLLPPTDELNQRATNLKAFFDPFRSADSLAPSYLVAAQARPGSLGSRLKIQSNCAKPCATVERGLDASTICVGFI